MFSMTRFDRHARLIARMTDALGIDLEAELLSGRLRPEAFRSQILRCTGCPNPDGCERWLDAQDGFAEETPDFCRNKSNLDARAHGE